MDHAQLLATTDVQTLRAWVVEQLQIIAERERSIADQQKVIVERDSLIAHHERTLSERDANIAKLNAEIARLRRVQFAARSEKMDPAQRALFDESMAEDIAAVEAALEALQSPASDATEGHGPAVPPSAAHWPKTWNGSRPGMSRMRALAASVAASWYTSAITSARSCRASR